MCVFLLNRSIDLSSSQISLFTHRSMLKLIYAMPIHQCFVEGGVVLVRTSFLASTGLSLIFKVGASFP